MKPDNTWGELEAHRSVKGEETKREALLVGFKEALAQVFTHFTIPSDEAHYHRYYFLRYLRNVQSFRTFGLFRKRSLISPPKLHFLGSPKKEKADCDVALGELSSQYGAALASIQGSSGTLPTSTA